MAFISASNAVRLYAGLLSFVCAETLTGASMYWVINPFTYLVTFPLYLTHILFFYSLAHKLNRRSFKDLYLFGILFGLYESWVTKVLWAGYPGEDHFILGTFLGHGIHETLVLILYFHPIVSFLFPLWIMQTLFPEIEQEIGIKESFIKKSGFMRFLFLFSFVALAFGPPQQFTSLFSPLLHWVPTIFIVYAGYIYTRRKINKNNGKEIVCLELSGLGVKVFGAVIALFYLFTYFNLLPEKIPPLWVQVVTIGIYGLIIFMIYRLRRGEEGDDGRAILFMNGRKLLNYFIIMSVSTTLVFIISLFIPNIVRFVAAICFLLMMVVGLICFWRWGLKDLTVPKKFKT